MLNVPSKFLVLVLVLCDSGLAIKDFPENGISQNAAHVGKRTRRHFPQAPPLVHDFPFFFTAEVYLFPADDKEVIGKVNITQYSHDRRLLIQGYLRGLDPGNYSFHANEYGDTNQRCKLIGPFYPADTPEAPFGRPSFAGKFIPHEASFIGDFEVGDEGVEDKLLTIFPFNWSRSRATLTGRYGFGPSIAGRTLALYKEIEPDESQTNNQWGPAVPELELVACGSIIIMK